ncbi:hypothetical protein BDY17DRAFT_294118 [Neohortaea acidophila]|uniref:Uncharacterized protein n=1 Tax=Neohortaea acidophila TaxID=245834 RepID=A0A6A6Q108_9PEZI|nr:uncharacterized protein BDY17DRAFT_294118 [Neohortaea acidophila]KAF2485711.1 hypothetical protein BDY17DRAFT_294118 [Neohortaea acidophila]
MPSASSSGKVISYTAKTARKTQQNLPIKRRYIRRKAPTLFPSSTDIQTTLTQCDFGVPSSNSREDSDIPSDDELESSRPKKRAKTRAKFGKREADQSTMTQFDRGLLPQLLRRSRSAGVGSGKMEVWEDDDFAWWGSEVDRGPQQTTAFLDGANEETDHADQLASEILETSPTRIESSQWDELGPERRPSGAPTELHTPRKVRFTREVPSSQTPPSAKSSAPMSTPRRVWQTSPLKERSANIAARVTKSVSPESQNTTMKILERIRFRSRNGPVTGGIVTKPSPQRVPSSQERVEASCSPSPLRPARTLHRVTTIQDSQLDEDSSLEVTYSHHTSKPTPKMTRTVTVQDSQAEDLDLDDLDDINEAHLTHKWNSYEDAHTASDDLGPATYDPAYSALDRDAARFGQTQATQLLSDRFKDGIEDSETEDDDLDAIYVPRETRPQAGDSTNAEDASASQSNDTPRPKEAPAPMPHTTADASAAIDSQPLARRSEPHLPSSPPALRPSQVSTVVPSQFTPIQPRPKRKHDLISSPPAKESTFPPTSPPASSALRCSPQSSPFLLPPALTSSAQKVQDDEDCDEIPTQAPAAVRRFELESLVDFSLPPPPPLSSSNRSWA